MLATCIWIEYLFYTHKSIQIAWQSNQWDVILFNNGNMRPHIKYVLFNLDSFGAVKLFYIDKLGILFRSRDETKLLNKIDENCTIYRFRTYLVDWLKKMN